TNARTAATMMLKPIEVSRSMRRRQSVSIVACFHGSVDQRLGHHDEPPLQGTVRDAESSSEEAEEGGGGGAEREPSPTPAKLLRQRREEDAERVLDPVSEREDGESAPTTIQP